MEKKFGRKHPKLESFKEPLPPYRFLADAFFRLHRRRQLTESGYQPLPFNEMADFCERVLRLPKDLHSLYYLAIEETDNGVLYDHYQKSKAALDAASKERETKRTKGPSIRRPRSKG